MEKCVAFFLIQMHNNFCIAGGVKVVAFFYQFFFQFFVVIYLAIKNDADAFVFVENGLVAGVQVDDGKAAVS